MAVVGPLWPEELLEKFPNEITTLPAGAKEHVFWPKMLSMFVQASSFKTREDSVLRVFVRLRRCAYRTVRAWGTTLAGAIGEDRASAGGIPDGLRRGVPENHPTGAASCRRLPRSRWRGGPRPLTVLSQAADRLRQFRRDSEASRRQAEADKAAADASASLLRSAAGCRALDRVAGHGVAGVLLARRCCGARWARLLTTTSRDHDGPPPRRPPIPTPPLPMVYTRRWNACWSYRSETFAFHINRLRYF